MLTLVNGREENQVSVNDRGLMYGQCVFETIAVHAGRPCLLDLHLARLVKGARVLGIRFTLADLEVIKAEVAMLAEPFKKGIVRINLTMGEGGRGYQNPDVIGPTRVISQHEYPNYPIKHWVEGIHLGLVDIRLSHQPFLAGIKHGNRLEQIIARSQWRDDWCEALVLDGDDNVIEATQSNIFLVNNGHLITPLLTNAGVAGVMRECIIELAKQQGLSIEIKEVSIDDVEQADEVFLSNSVIGIWPVKKFKSKLYIGFKVTNKLLKNIINNEFIPNI